MARPPFALAAARACQLLLGERPARIGHPGGKSRRAVRAHLADRTVIVAYRKHAERARLEAAVLRALGERGAPVPRILASEGRWILQEDLGARRLSEALDPASDSERAVLLGAALASLARIHEIGSEAGLDRLVAPVERKPGWLPGLLSMPSRIGRHLGVPAPELPEGGLRETLRLRSPRFIKWDARPGNANVGADGDVSWFDWEHCACRNRLDDVAWLLADEYVEVRPETEARILEGYVGRFADDSSLRAALDYVYAFGVFHSCVRLSLILSRKGDGDWWDWAYCLRGDKIGVTLDAGLRLCRRGARWSAAVPTLSALAGWFPKVAERIAVSEDRPPTTPALSLPAAPDRGSG